MKSDFFSALTAFIIYSVIIIGISGYFVFNDAIIGPMFIILGILGIFALKILKIKLKSVYPDVVFGVIDNGVLVFAAIIGASYAGIAGAIIGGAAGNAITDGIGGLFEGHVAQNQRKYEIDNLRTPLATSLGKIIGCLLGAGVGLIIINLIKIIH